MRLGVLPEVLREACPLREVAVFAYGDKIGSWDLDGILDPAPCPLILGQDRTQHILANRVKSRGVAVEWGVEAVRLEVRADGVQAGLKSRFGEEDMDASFVVGCEGSNSLVRQTLNLTFEDPAAVPQHDLFDFDYGTNGQFDFLLQAILYTEGVTLALSSR